MRGQKGERRRDGERDVWPRWLEPLRPDMLARRRMHKRVMAAAESLLGRRRRTWTDVTAGWSAVLTPLAAGLAVAFGMLAYRASVPEIADDLAVETPPAAGVVVDPHLGLEADVPPALLIDVSEPSREAVFSAALTSSR